MRRVGDIISNRKPPTFLRKRNFNYREGYTDFLITAQTGLIKKAKEASVIGDDMQIL